MGGMPVNQSLLSTWSPRGIPEAIDPVNSLFIDKSREEEKSEGGKAGES